MKKTILLAISLLSVASQAVPAFAAQPAPDSTQRSLAPVRFEQGTVKARCWVQIRVWEEINTGRGAFLGEFTLAKDQTQSFSTSSGRIRYDYRIVASDPFHGDVGMWLRGGDTKSVP